MCETGMLQGIQMDRICAARRLAARSSQERIRRISRLLCGTLSRTVIRPGMLRLHVGRRRALPAWLWPAVVICESLQQITRPRRPQPGRTGSTRTGIAPLSGPHDFPDPGEISLAGVQVPLGHIGVQVPRDTSLGIRRAAASEATSACQVTSSVAGSSARLPVHHHIATSLPSTNEPSGYEQGWCGRLHHDIVASSPAGLSIRDSAARLRAQLK
jgi:hypothetical protein